MQDQGKRKSGGAKGAAWCSEYLREGEELLWAAPALHYRSDSKTQEKSQHLLNPLYLFDVEEVCAVQGKLGSAVPMCEGAQIHTVAGKKSTLLTPQGVNLLIKTNRNGEHPSLGLNLLCTLV